MPEITAERWQELYDRAFPQVYRALVAATLDRERALDGLHDAFEEGLRHPPADDRNLEIRTGISYSSSCAISTVSSCLRAAAGGPCDERSHHS